MAKMKFPSYRTERMGGYLVLLGEHRDGKSYDAWSAHEGLVPASKGYVSRVTKVIPSAQVPAWLKAKFETGSSRSNPARKAKSTAAGRAAVLDFINREGIQIVPVPHGDRRTGGQIVVMRGDGTWQEFDTQAQVVDHLREMMTRAGHRIANPSLKTHVKRGECRPTSKGRRIMARKNPGTGADHAMAYEIASYLYSVSGHGKQGPLLAAHLRKTAAKPGYLKSKYVDFLAKSHMIQATKDYLGPRQAREWSDFANMATRKEAANIFIDNVLNGEW